MDEIERDTDHRYHRRSIRGARSIYREGPRPSVAITGRPNAQAGQSTNSTSRQCSFGRTLSVRIRAIGIALLGIGGVVALVSFGTRLGQTLAAILVLIGGALMAASRLIHPAGAETDLSASPASRT